MLLAELEIFHSRPIAPTRRISIGRSWLPGPHDGSGLGAGGLLVGAVCAGFGSRLSHDLLGEVMALVHDLELMQSVAQPRLRHRLQSDRVGLTRSCQRLFGPGENCDVEQLVCEFESFKATPGQLVLGAVYAASRAGPTGRGEALQAARRGLVWRGDVGPAMFSYLTANLRPLRPAQSVEDPVGWALETLGLGRDVEMPGEAAVRRGFREALRAAHPDLGAAEAEAADRIARLSEARRILLTR